MVRVPDSIPATRPPESSTSFPVNETPTAEKPATVPLQVEDGAGFVTGDAHDRRIAGDPPGRFSCNACAILQFGSAGLTLGREGLRFDV